METESVPAFSFPGKGEGKPIPSKRLNTLREYCKSRFLFWLLLTDNILSACEANCPQILLLTSVFLSVLYMYMNSDSDSNSAPQVAELVESALRTLADLCERRVSLEKEINNWNMAIRGMAKMLPDTKSQESVMFRLGLLKRPTGLTHDIKESLSQSPDGMTTAQIRSYMENHGFDLTEYSQPLSTIGVTLSRMENKMDVRSYEKDGKKYWKLTNIGYKLVQGVKPKKPRKK